MLTHFRRVGPSTLQRLCSTPRAFSAATLSEDDKRRADINRLLYRSRQRGWLELDLLMGMWAEQNVPKMSSEILEDYHKVLAEENPDLFKWLTNQLPTPDYLQQNKAYQLLYESVQKTLDENSVVSTRATPGQDWVRGWDDNKREPLTPEGKNGA